jgi:hypothetical protein
LSKQSNWSVVGGNNFLSVIGGSVVDYNNFQIFKSLIKYAIERLRDVILAIIGWDNDGDSWFPICHAKDTSFNLRA